MLFIFNDLFLKTFEIPEFNLNDARNLYNQIIYVVLNLPLRIDTAFSYRHRFGYLNNRFDWDSNKTCSNNSNFYFSSAKTFSFRDYCV